MPSLLDRLKQRKLVQWALAYLAGAWLVLQLLDVLADTWSVSVGMQRGIQVVLVGGFLITLILAWYHGEQGRQRVSGPELLMIGGLLALTAAVLTLTGRGDQQPDVVESDADPAPSLERAKPAIAVLPFDNFSPDPDNAYFAAGMHEEIIGQLAKISGLVVISRSSVMGYAEDRPPLLEIAAALGVDFILEGSARRAEKRVRLTAQLIDGKTDEHLWVENYDRDLSVEDLFAIQDDLAQRVGDALSAVILPEESAQLAELPTTSLRAYEHYLRGRSHAWTFAGLQDIGITEAAIEELDEAVRIDPAFRLAHGWLALNHAVHAWWVGRSTQTDIARRVIARSSTVAPTLPETLIARALLAVSTIPEDTVAIDTLIAPVLRQRPRDGTVLTGLAAVQRASGDTEGAIATLEHGLAMDPLNGQVHFQIGQSYLHAHRYRDAEAAFQRVPSIDPALELAGLSYGTIALLTRTGDVDRVREHVESWPAEQLDRMAGVFVFHPNLSLVRVLPQDMQLRVWDAGAQKGWPWSQGRYYQTIGDDERAAMHFHEAAQAIEEGPTGAFLRAASLAIIYSHLGREDAATTALRDLADEPQEAFLAGPYTKMITAEVLARFGRVEEAIDILEQALPAPSWLSVPLLRVDPIWDALRDHPRFQTLLEKYEHEAY